MMTLTSVDADDAVANRTPSAHATSARFALTSTSSTSQPALRLAKYAARHPTVPAPMTTMRLPAAGSASHTTLTAVALFAARTARDAGTPSGTTWTADAGTTYAD